MGTAQLVSSLPTPRVPPQGWTAQAPGSAAASAGHRPEGQAEPAWGGVALPREEVTWRRRGGRRGAHGASRSRPAGGACRPRPSPPPPGGANQRPLARLGCRPPARSRRPSAARTPRPGGARYVLLSPGERRAPQVWAQPAPAGGAPRSPNASQNQRQPSPQSQRPPASCAGCARQGCAAAAAGGVRAAGRSSPVESLRRRPAPRALSSVAAEKFPAGRGSPLCGSAAPAGVSVETAELWWPCPRPSAPPPAGAERCWAERSRRPLPPSSRSSPLAAAALAVRVG